jgi:hypothetical protein
MKTIKLILSAIILLTTSVSITANTTTEEDDSKKQIKETSELAASQEIMLYGCSPIPQCIEDGEQNNLSLLDILLLESQQTTDTPEQD